MRLLITIMPINLDKILEHCRLCQVNPGSVQIEDNIEFINQVFECTKIKINDDKMHMLPRTVCSSCKFNIEEFVLFAKQIKLVNQKLHDQLSEHKSSEVSSPYFINTALKEPVKINDEISRFQCPVCFKIYAKYRNLQLHKRGHTNAISHSCGLGSDSDTVCKNHTCGIKKESVVNEVCKNDYGDISLKSNVDFNNSENVKARLLNISENKEPKKEWFEDEFPIKDGDCLSINVLEKDQKQQTEVDKTEKNILKDVVKYGKSQGMSFLCTYGSCGKLCTSAYTLRTHLMRHEGKMPFLCVTCGKGFTTKNSLNCHEKIHAEVKGYVCKECNIGFSVASNLRAHQKKHHEGVRFYCSQCTRAFITKCSLERHELVHTGVKEFKCSSCRAAFYTNKELLKHQRYHQGVRSYKCDQCFKTFFEKHHLTIHIRVHTGERPYACKVVGCGKSFAESQKLSRHIKARHPPT